MKELQYIFDIDYGSLKKMEFFLGKTVFFSKHKNILQQQHMSSCLFFLFRLPFRN